MLLARRNDDLAEFMRKEREKIEAKDGRGPAVPEKKGRGRPAAKGIAKGKGKAKQ
jgi:hypothetical protein